MLQADKVGVDYTMAAPSQFGESTIRFSINGCPHHSMNMPSAGPTTRRACTTKAS
jgi:hypothetical protein